MSQACGYIWTDNAVITNLTLAVGRRTSECDCWTASGCRWTDAVQGACVYYYCFICQSYTRIGTVCSTRLVARYYGSFISYVRSVSGCLLVRHGGMVTVSHYCVVIAVKCEESQSEGGLSACSGLRGFGNVQPHSNRSATYRPPPPPPSRRNPLNVLSTHGVGGICDRHLLQSTIRRPTTASYQSLSSIPPAPPCSALHRRRRRCQ